jgi:hypothetical protein
MTRPRCAPTLGSVSPFTRRLLSWTLLLALCCTLRGACGPHASACVPAAAVRLLAPRALGAGVAWAGPAVLWAPLAVWLRGALAARGGGGGGGGGGGNAGLRFAPALFASVAAFLACANAARGVKRIAALNGLDPSGHTLVIGVQLVPGWALAQLLAEQAAAQRGSGGGGGAPTVAPLSARAAAALEPALWLVSAGTAAFFHTPAEIALAWVAVAALALFARAALRARAGPGAAALCARLLAAGAAAWLASLALLAAAGADIAGDDALRAHAVHDAAVLAAAALLYRCSVHAHPEDGVAKN